MQVFDVDLQQNRPDFLTLAYGLETMGSADLHKFDDIVGINLIALNLSVRVVRYFID